MLIGLNIAKQDGKEKLLKHLETGGELSVSVEEKLASHRQGIMEEAKANIKQAQEKQKEVYTTARMPTQMLSNLAPKS